MNRFKFSLSLRVFSRSIDPSEISARLNLSPKWYNRAGEARRTPKGKVVGGLYDLNYCSFVLDANGDSDLHEVVSRNVGLFAEHKDLFGRVRGDGGRVEFFIGWFSPGNTGDLFDFELLGRLSELKIDLAFDVYGAS